MGEHPKIFEDVTVGRLIAWLWQNFRANQLIFEFISGEGNGFADVLSG